ADNNKDLYLCIDSNMIIQIPDGFISQKEQELETTKTKIANNQITPEQCIYLKKEQEFLEFLLPKIKRSSQLMEFANLFAQKNLSYYYYPIEEHQIQNIKNISYDDSKKPIINFKDQTTNNAYPVIQQPEVNPHLLKKTNVKRDNGNIYIKTLSQEYMQNNHLIKIDTNTKNIKYIVIASIDYNSDTSQNISNFNYITNIKERILKLDIHFDLVDKTNIIIEKPLYLIKDLDQKKSINNQKLFPNLDIQSYLWDDSLVSIPNQQLQNLQDKLAILQLQEQQDQNQDNQDLSFLVPEQFQALIAQYLPLINETYRSFLQQQNAALQGLEQTVKDVITRPNSPLKETDKTVISLRAQIRNTQRFIMWILRNATPSNTLQTPINQKPQFTAEKQQSINNYVVSKSIQKQKLITELNNLINVLNNSNPSSNFADLLTALDQIANNDGPDSTLTQEINKILAILGDSQYRKSKDKFIALENYFDTLWRDLRIERPIPQEIKDLSKILVQQLRTKSKSKDKFNILKEFLTKLKQQKDHKLQVYVESQRQNKTDELYAQIDQETQEKQKMQIKNIIKHIIDIFASRIHQPYFTGRRNIVFHRAKPLHDNLKQFKIYLDTMKYKSLEHNEDRITISQNNDKIKDVDYAYYNFYKDNQLTNIDVIIRFRPVPFPSVQEEHNNKDFQNYLNPKKCLDDIKKKLQELNEQIQTDSPQRKIILVFLERPLYIFKEEQTYSCIHNYYTMDMVRDVNDASGTFIDNFHRRSRDNPNTLNPNNIQIWQSVLSLLEKPPDEIKGSLQQIEAGTFTYNPYDYPHIIGYTHTEYYAPQIIVGIRNEQDIRHSIRQIDEATN
ncbi:MAG: hypothetical protein ACQBVK_02325, partial [Candidatus Phytoplasma sp. TWB_XP]